MTLKVVDNVVHGWVYPDPADASQTPLTPAGGVVDIDSNSVQRDIQAAAALVVQSTAAITDVQVKGPNPNVWSDYPGTTTADADNVLVIHGRWSAVRVTTAGNVYVRADYTPVYGNLGS